MLVINTFAVVQLLFAMPGNAAPDVAVSKQECINDSGTIKDFEKAKAFFDKKQYDEAISAYQQISMRCKAMAPYHDAQIKIGEIQLKRHKTHEARKEYEKVLASNSDKLYKAKAIDGVFYSYLLDNNFVKAEEFYANTMKALGYSEESQRLGVKQRQNVIARWKKDLPDKQKILALINSYNKMLAEKNIDGLKTMFVKEISNARTNALRGYVRDNPLESRTIENVEINISDSGNTATAEFQVHVTKESVGETIGQIREAFFKFKREAGEWKISE